MYLYLPFNPDFNSNPFLLSMMKIEAGTTPRQPPYETGRAWRALSFKSARQFTTHLPLLNLRSREAPPRPPTSPVHRKNRCAPPRISASMQFAIKRACCAAQATRTAWCGDGLSTLTAPTAAHRGCPERTYETDMTLVKSPEYGPGVR